MQQELLRVLQDKKTKEDDKWRMGRIRSKSYGHSPLDDMSFGSLKSTHCFNHMRYHDTSIKNTCCHQPSSTMTQSIRIYDHLKVLPISQGWKST